jgi:hypothetical protein
MDELKWELLTAVQGRLEADLLKAYFESCGVEVELFQESLGQHVYPTALDMLGRVEIFVSKAQAEEARKLLEEFHRTEESPNTDE